MNYYSPNILETFHIRINKLKFRFVDGRPSTGRFPNPLQPRLAFVRLVKNFIP